MGTTCQLCLGFLSLSQAAYWAKQVTEMLASTIPYTCVCPCLVHKPHGASRCACAANAWPSGGQRKPLLAVLRLHRRQRKQVRGQVGM